MSNKKIQISVDDMFSNSIVPSNNEIVKQEHNDIDSKVSNVNDSSNKATNEDEVIYEKKQSSYKITKKKMTREEKVAKEENMSIERKEEIYKSYTFIKKKVRNDYPITIHLPQDVYNELDEIATATDRSINECISLILSNVLLRNRKEKK